MPEPLEEVITMGNGEKRFKEQDLRAFAVAALKKTGFDQEYAETTARGVVEAHLRGTHNQGLGRLPQYVKRIQKGLISTKPELKIENETPSIAILDAGNAMGHYGGTRAMELAVSKAEATGIGAVGVKNSNHFGVAGYYSQIAARRNMIGIVFTNSTALLSAPGGGERVIGNNPFSVAVPSDDPEYPIVLDMACSNAAFSAIQSAAQAGEEVPLGWGTDKEGVETTDPKAILDGGLLLPSGGYKGYGMAVMFDILAGVLTGSAFTKDVSHLYQDMEGYQRTGHFMIALNIDRFLGLSLFSGRLSTFVASIKESKKAPGVTELWLPGDKEIAIKRDALAKGIALPAKIVELLDGLADSLEITRLA